MSYATQQQLVDSFGELEVINLTDRNGTGVIDTAVLNRHLTRATNTINGYLRSRVTLPLDPAVVDESPLPGIAADLWRYYAQEDGASEDVRNRYNDALRWLRDFGQGVVELPATAGGSQPANDALITRSGQSRFDWSSYYDWSTW